MKHLLLSIKTLLVVIAAFACSHGLAAPVNYKITFTQTWRAHDPTTPGYEWLGPRLLTGHLSIDDSVLGPSHANRTYGLNSPELAAISSYTVTIDGRVYPFDSYSTGFTTVIRTDATGAIADLQGAFRLPNSFSVVELGRDGYDGTYIDVQQVDSFNSVAVSSGTYTFTLVPEEKIGPVDYGQIEHYEFSDGQTRDTVESFSAGTLPDNSPSVQKSGASFYQSSGQKVDMRAVMEFQTSAIYSAKFYYLVLSPWSVYAGNGISKYPPAEPGALDCEPLKAAWRGR